MALTGPVWPLVDNGGQLWSRISSLQELDHFKAELRDHGLLYQVIACTALRDKIGQIWSKKAYNGPVFVIVSSYIRLGHICACIIFLEQFWHFLSGLIILRWKCQVARKWPEIVHNHTICPVIERYDQLWPHLTEYIQFWSISTSATEKATYDLCRQPLAYTA